MPAVAELLDRRRASRLMLAAGYLVVLLGPLLLMARMVTRSGRPPADVFADALGFAALSLMALQVATSGRWASTTRAFGLRKVLSLHREAGMAVVVLVVAHVLVLVLADPRRFGLLESWRAPLRAQAGMLAVVSLAVLGASTVALRRGRVSYELWRGLHVICTASALAGAFVHADLVDAFTSAPGARGVMLLLVVGAAAALFWTRVAHPYSSASRPYRVRAVRRELGQAVTVELEADGHPGMRFGPGQFARIRTPDRLYGMGDHPFSLTSSAARPREPAFTVKALGDYSSSLVDLQPGTEVLLAGPHGEAVHDGPRVRGRLLLAAGIGITPALSVLRTAADRGDRRPHLLLYGTRSWADTTFRQEIAELQRQLPDLRVVHILSRGEDGWAGERGHISDEALQRLLPIDLRGWTALLCGPSAMVTGCSTALRAHGLPASAIQAEGFD